MPDFTSTIIGLHSSLRYIYCGLMSSQPRFCLYSGAPSMRKLLKILKRSTPIWPWHYPWSAVDNFENQSLNYLRLVLLLKAIICPPALYDYVQLYIKQSCSCFVFIINIKQTIIWTRSYWCTLDIVICTRNHKTLYQTVLLLLLNVIVMS
jgi:hypothetical protein